MRKIKQLDEKMVVYKSLGFRNVGSPVTQRQIPEKEIFQNLTSRYETNATLPGAKDPSGPGISEDSCSHLFIHGTVGRTPVG